MENDFDVIVLGLGAMGSAALYQLSKTKNKVLGIDQFSPPTKFGSSYGDTRITRLAVGEGPEYVAFAKRSLEIWKIIENETSKKLFSQSGSLIMSVPNSQGSHGVKDFIGETIKTAKQYNINFETLTTKAIQKKFPQFNITNENAYLEFDSGYVLPEACIEMQINLAIKQGANVHTNEKVLSWTKTPTGVKIITSKKEYHAKKLIIAAGPWINTFFSSNKNVFKIYRQVLYWFDLKDKTQYDQLHKMPVFGWMHGKRATDFVFGFPPIDGPAGGMKIATEVYTQETNPDTVTRKVNQEEINTFYNEHVKDKFPFLSDKCIKAYACLYTVTPDHKFVIDYHPDSQNVIIASPCSGHGFKHSAAIGELLSQLATHGETELSIEEFSLKRFGL